ncbi:MAG: glycosyltransferase family A protein [Verrucomicrobiales bacterium]|nr:glycosyltransferase family A protein [Verrucomicrobiales bacterium]
MSNLPVTVVIPAFNAESFLADAIDSALTQTCPPEEIIVVNDGSDDSTGRIAGEYGRIVTVLHQDHTGVSAARNRGLRQAEQEFLAFLDADDIMVPNRLETQWNTLAEKPETDLLFGQEHRFKGAAPVLPLDSEARSIPAQIPGTIFCRRSVFDEYGLFDERVDADDFIGWFVKAVDSGLSWDIVKETLILRRFHDQNFSRQMVDGDAYTHLVKAMLDRRRERE